jgi:metallo-beta-lactamase class B
VSRLLIGAVLLLGGAAAAQQPTCQSCAAWNVTQAPFRVYGNTYYVGVRGLSSILITSPEGHALIDGALPESAAKIAASIRTLGFRVEDVRLIVNSHAHFDHAGGVAELQRLSGAKVSASDASARVLRCGRSGPDDPQYGELMPFPPVREVDVVKDGDTLRVGTIALTVHATGGHTQGGTTWTWRSCEQSRCVDMVYADSLTPVSASRFKFADNRGYPHAVADFEKSFETIERLPCDILLTPHPDASNLRARLEKRTDGGSSKALIDGTGCRRYVAGARQRLATRLADEQKK